MAHIIDRGVIHVVLPTGISSVRCFDIRRYVGCRRGDSVAIVLSDDDSAPAMAGESYHYETLGGRRIWHPSAYSRRGWSNMRYVGSTRRLVVGEEWIIEHEFDLTPRTVSDAGIPMAV